MANADETSLSAPVRTLLELIEADFRDSGKRGSLSRAFIEEWRERNEPYGRWPLSTLFASGSMVPIRGKTHLQRATEAFIEQGNPTPGSVGCDREAFEEFVSGYVDEFCEEFYAA